MSGEVEEKLVHIASVDVDCSTNKNEEKNEKTCDSGIECGDSCSLSLPSPSECVVSLVESPEPGITEDIDKLSQSIDSPNNVTPISLSPDLNDATETLLSLEECAVDKSEAKASEFQTIPNEFQNLCKLEHLDNNVENIEKPDTEITKDNTDNPTAKSNIELPFSGPIIDLKEFDNAQINNIMTNSGLNKTSDLASSSVSLDEQTTLNSQNVTISKSPYSRSAENISITEISLQENVNLSSKNVDSEKILSEFSAQKNKVTATQKLTQDIPKAVNETQHYDGKYARIPKELLSQDLGSIVKNVHGIFSSVSGSLKSAYNNSQRLPKTPINKNIRPIPNGKLMDDIFEDSIEKIEENVLEKSTVKNQVLGDDKTEGVLSLEQKETDSETKDILHLQIESLERVLAEQRKENASLRERVKQQVDELDQKDQTFKDLEVKVDLMSKRVEQAEREKDAAVMRYASVECAAIEARRSAEKAAAAEKAAITEMELLNGKLKSAHGEKQRICQLYDDKCHELSVSERELAKVREDVKELEGRLKWTQSKLRMEMDAYKDSAERVEKLSAQVTELEAAKAVAAAGAEDSVRARHLESELKEIQAALILCRHEKDDLDRRLTALTQQYDVCKRDRDAATSALAIATLETEKLKMCNLRLEEEAAELAALRAKAALADTLSAQLQRESERAHAAEESLVRERARADTCSAREAAALAHAAKLTAEHVHRRDDVKLHHDKAQALALDNASLRERITTLEDDCKKLHASLNDEVERRNRETRALARKVAELTEELSSANQKLEWEQGENAVLKRKHNNAIKELNRELQRALKRCEQLEAKLPATGHTSDRTGSISSLSSGESAPNEERAQNGHAEGLPDIQVVEPDRQQLIERIVSLQRAAARRAERCDFLEEHSKQLTSELRGKSKLLRHLLAAMPAGAVVSQSSDQHKKEIARLGGGAMAAVWGGDTAGMTLELSLEMNTRLQAVLEDALLKNITLKENMDTLGEEIARLKEQINTKTDKPK